MATLDRDLLFEIAGKLVMASGDFSEPTNSLFDNIMNSLDFSRPTDLAAVKFMLVNRACKRAFLSQFSIIKTVCLHRSNHRFSRFNENLTEYYENDDKLWLIALLIHNGKFKPRELLLENFFTEISGLGKYVSEKGGRSAMKCFSNLFGLDKVGLYLDGYHGPKLLLDRLGLRERKKCSVKLDTLLRLDAKEVAILLESEEYSQVKISGFSRVNSTSVQKFKILAYDCWSLEEYGMSNSTTKKWFQLMSYVMSSCPNLKKLTVCIQIKEATDNYTGALKSFLKAVKAVKNVMLPQLLRSGCFIMVKLLSRSPHVSTAKFDELNDELFSIGVAKLTVDRNEIYHVVKFGSRAELSFTVIGGR